MFRKLWVCAACLILLAGFAAAEENFILDGQATISGMEHTWLQGYEPTVEGDRVSICLPLTSEVASGKITATLALDDESTSPLRKQRMSESFYRDEHNIYPVRLRLRLLSDYENGDYAGRIHVEGVDRDGGPLSGDFPIVLHLRGGQASSEALRPDFSVVPTPLNIGENGSLTVAISNPCRYAEMTDLLLSVSDPTGDILPAGSGVTALGDLAPGQSLTATVPLSVLPSAKVLPHAVTLSLSFTSLDQSREWSEDFTLPVNQEIRLEHGGVQLPTTVLQKGTATLTLPLMNLGRSDVRNAMASLTLPGIADGQTVLVGTIAPGETKEAKISFTPGSAMLGEVTGTIAVSGEDDWGNGTSFSLPVELTVEVPVEDVLAINPATQAFPVQLPWLTYALSACCAVLLLALILQGILFRSKVRKLEEERL